jgi:hypothetical protein
MVFPYVFPYVGYGHIIPASKKGFLLGYFNGIPAGYVVVVVKPS